MSILVKSSQRNVNIDSHEEIVGKRSKCQGMSEINGGRTDHCADVQPLAPGTLRVEMRLFLLIRRLWLCKQISNGSNKRKVLWQMSDWLVGKGHWGF